MAQKLIIDADPGVSDALAILVALVDPSIEVVGLTAVAGSVSGAKATRNLQFLTDLVDPLKHPRIGQCELPTQTDQVKNGIAPTRHHYCGRDGLGDLKVEVPDLHNRRESGKLIVDLVRESPHEVRLLTLGPLTNVMTAWDLDPELPAHLDGIVCLGGCTSIGDVTAVAEFNIWADPEAAAQVLQWPTAKTLVPLEVSGSPILTFEDVDLMTDLIEETTNGETLTSMLQYAVRINHHHLASEGIPLHAVAALAVAARAESFTVEPVRADIETAGELTRGMTVIDRRAISRRQTNVDLASSIDVHGVIDYFSRSFRRAAR